MALSPLSNELADTLYSYLFSLNASIAFPAVFGHNRAIIGFEPTPAQPEPIRAVGRLASRCLSASRPLWDLRPAVHGGAGEAALQPGRGVLEGIEPDEIARAVEADQVAHPAEHGDVGDRVVVAHDPLSSGEPRLEHGEQALRLVAI